MAKETEDTTKPAEKAAADKTASLSSSNKYTRSLKETGTTETCLSVSFWGSWAFAGSCFAC